MFAKIVAVAGIASAAASSIAAAPPHLLDKRGVSGTATVYLNQLTGSPQHLASGFIYGIPDAQGQVPDHFYTDIDFSFGRAGGAQIPQRGWMAGVAAYKVRKISAIPQCLSSASFPASLI